MNSHSYMNVLCFQVVVKSLPLSGIHVKNYTLSE